MRMLQRTEQNGASGSVMVAASPAGMEAAEDEDLFVSVLER